MRLRFRWLLLLAGLFFVPSSAFAQMDVPLSPFVGPLSNPRPEGGGFYVNFNFVYMRTSRPMPVSQEIAVRGLVDLDGQISGTQGAFLGSGEPALNTDQLRGPGNDQPGWDLFVGWKFQNGIAVEIGMRHLVQAKYSAAANILPPSFNLGTQFESTFLYSPVSNFGTAWGGAAQNIPQGSGASTFGIWNGASIMQIDFIQRFDIYTLNVRMPITQTESHRSYGLFGPRIVWIWDRFHWRTVDTDVNGNDTADAIANYTNTISNRMYGLHAGFGNDWYLGSTPIGAFSFELDVEGGLYLDLVKTRASYAREDGAVASTRARRISALSPSFEVRTGIKWYPYEGITVELGYDIMGYFNTIASPRPVDFNLSQVDPQYDHILFRMWQGLRFGVTFTF